VILLSSILRRAVYPALSRAGVFSRQLRTDEVGVLTYHGVLRERPAGTQPPTDATLLSADQFHRQLRFLKSRYKLITPQQFRQWWVEKGALPARAVLLTCDDGLLNVLTDLVPILREEEAQCLFFVTGASLQDATTCLWYEELYRMLEDAAGDAKIRIGESSVRKDSLARRDLARCAWSLIQELSGLNPESRNSALGSLRAQWRLPGDWRPYDPGDAGAERRYRLLNRSELRQLVVQGMTVGAHTMSHPLLPSMSAESAEREIHECRSQLESCLRQEIWALAYPFGNEGSAGEREMRMAHAAGYTCAFLNYGGGHFDRARPPYGLPRAHVTAEMDLPEIEAHLSGFHDRLQRRFRGEDPARREEASDTCA
jgi:peptidoglycan/xylan/chitin deacetylase (PgdA/CDA1 family)